MVDIWLKKQSDMITKSQTERVDVERVKENTETGNKFDDCPDFV